MIWIAKALANEQTRVLILVLIALSGRNLAQPADEVAAKVNLIAAYTALVAPATVVPAAVWPWAIGLVSDQFPSSHGSLFTSTHMDSFPTGRDLWSLLENQDSASVVNRIDVGGIYGGTFALFSARGGSWTQNHFYLNGLNVTDPYTGGTPLFYPDYDFLKEVEVSTGGHGAKEPGGGSVVSVTSEQASRQLHGDMRVYYQGSPTSWTNLTERLKSQGATGSREIKADHQVHAQLGSPLGGSRWAYLGSVSSRQLRLKIPRFAEVEQRDLASGLLDFRRDSGLQSLGFRWTGQQLGDSHSPASFRTPVSSTLVRQDTFNVLQGAWRMAPHPELHLDGRVGLARSHLEGTFNDASRPSQSGLDLFTEFRSGAAPFQSESIRTRLSAAFHVSYTRGYSQVLAGIDASRGYSRSVIDTVDAVGLRFLPADLEANPLVRGETVPSSVIQYNTPVHPRQKVEDLALFAQYAWRPISRLSLRSGLRIDSTAGSLPAQSRPGGPFAEARSFPEQKDLISWLDIEPRIGVAVSPFCGRARSDAIFQCGTIFRAGFGIFHHGLNARYLDFQNPNSLSGTEWTWEDLNGDRQYQPGEAGRMLRAFGGEVSSIDLNLKRPYSREFVIGAEQKLPWGFGFRADFFRRDEKDRLETVNLGVPFSAYTPVTVFDPGGDYEPGTADDQNLVVYNQDPSTLGKDSFLLTNPEGLNGFHKGLEMVLSYRGGAWGVMALHFSAYMTRVLTSPGNTEFENDQGVIGGLLDNPNSLIWTYGRQYFDRSFTVRYLGLFQLGRGWTVSTVARYYDGLPFGRKLIITGFNQGPFFVYATPRGNPGGHRTEFNLTADLRIRKILTWRGGDIRLVFDVFNLLNNSNKTEEIDLTGPWFMLRLPVEFQPPRIARLGVEFVF
ncbi:MAG TPA: hypothetical protein PLP42_11175 [Acidobacteriota bacterium]|mgnify:FL=1|nr:hypothetical protein [Acidobacteriota bacterium]